MIDQYQSNEKTSDILPSLFKKIIKEYTINRLFYAKGPGSFMAIKITYLFLKTISITKNLQLFATDGFTFNQNSPIKAIGNLYFIKKDGRISTQKIGDIKLTQNSFALPQQLDITCYSSDSEPLYVLPAL